MPLTPSHPLLTSLPLAPFISPSSLTQPCPPHLLAPYSPHSLTPLAPLLCLPLTSLAPPHPSPLPLVGGGRYPKTQYKIPIAPFPTLSLSSPPHSPCSPHPFNSLGTKHTNQHFHTLGHLNALAPLIFIIETFQSHHSTCNSIQTLLVKKFWAAWKIGTLPTQGKEHHRSMS